MKKKICLILAALVFSAALMLAFNACVRDDNKANTSLQEGEMVLTGKAEKVSGNHITLKADGNSISDKFYFYYTDEVTVVENGYYVMDLAADSFEGKEISVICSEMVQETYPAGLTDVRMIIINEKCKDG